MQKLSETREKGRMISLECMTATNVLEVRRGKAKLFRLHICGFELLPVFSVSAVAFR